MTTSTTVRVPTHAERPNMVSIGTIVWLSSELMFFAALFAMYFTLRQVNPAEWAASTEILNIPFSSVNTTVLVLSKTGPANTVTGIAVGADTYVTMLKVEADRWMVQVA